MRRRPSRNAAIPLRTSSAISLHVSASALRTASAFPRARLHAGRSVLDHHVVAPAVLHPNPDERPADVEHGGIKALDQPV